MIKCVLVTGGAGFIGSNLCTELLNQNYKVRVLDNLSTGSRNYLPYHSNLEFIEGDITNYNTCVSVCKNIEGIFHLAAMSKVLPSILNDDMMDYCTHVNVLGTFSNAVDKVTIIDDSLISIFLDNNNISFDNNMVIKNNNPSLTLTNSNKLQSSSDCL